VCVSLEFIVLFVGLTPSVLSPESIYFFLVIFYLKKLEKIGSCYRAQGPAVILFLFPSIRRCYELTRASRKGRSRETKEGMAISVGMKPTWTPGLLIEGLRELASGGFTWVESAL
jgi:hypothetical protein